MIVRILRKHIHTCILLDWTLMEENTHRINITQKRRYTHALTNSGFPKNNNPTSRADWTQTIHYSSLSVQGSKNPSLIHSRMKLTRERRLTTYALYILELITNIKLTLTVINLELNRLIKTGWPPLQSDRLIDITSLLIYSHTFYLLYKKSYKVYFINNLTCLICFNLWIKKIPKYIYYFFLFCNSLTKHNKNPLIDI